MWLSIEALPSALWGTKLSPHIHTLVSSVSYSLKCFCSMVFLGWVRIGAWTMTLNASKLLSLTYIQGCQIGVAIDTALWILHSKADQHGVSTPVGISGEASVRATEAPEVNQQTWSATVRKVFIQLNLTSWGCLWDKAKGGGQVFCHLACVLRLPPCKSYQHRAGQCSVAIITGQGGGPLHPFPLNLMHIEWQRTRHYSPFFRACSSRQIFLLVQEGSGLVAECVPERLDPLSFSH